MATRVVEGKKPYTGGEAIDIDQNKVISLKLRDENNLIIYDSGDDEIYVDLQLPDGITPTDAFPVGVTTGRVVVADGWDLAGTIICAKTTSGDNIKLLYADDGTLWIDNGTGTFKEIPLGGSAGADIEYVTQVEYDALPSSKLTDGKHYVIYTSDSPTPPSPRQPGVNTLAYYPLEIDTKDYSGNGRDGTNNGVTFSNNLGVFNGGSYVSLGTGSWTNIQTNMTISAWFNRNGSGIRDNCVVSKGQYYMPDTDIGYYAITIHEEDWYLCGGYYSGSDYNIHPMNFRDTGGGSPTTGPVVQANKWYNVVITNEGTTKKAYIDGVLYATENINTTTSTVSIDTRIGSFVRDSYDSFFNGNISKVIFENKARTAQEVADYYNQTKANYGIS